MAEEKSPVIGPKPVDETAGGMSPGGSRILRIMQRYPLDKYEYRLYPSRLLVSDILEYGLCKSVYFIAGKHPDGDVEVVAWFLTSVGQDKKSMWFDTKEFKRWILNREWKKIEIWDQTGLRKVYYRSQLSPKGR